MVAMSADSLLAAIEAPRQDFFVGIFEHFQLRLAAGDVDLRQRHLAFLRNLRKLVRPTERAALSPADQERLVLGVMSEIETFGQDAESNRAFKIELLWMMRDACPTPRLLGELFLSELLRADLLVKPDFWMYPRSGRAEMTLPRLEPRHPRS